MFLVDLQDGAHIPLPERGGMPPSVHVIQQEAIDALRAALVTGRPLLVRGEPGTGKSQLARAAAEALGRAFVPHAVDSRTETRDLLWSVDTVARLAEAQVLGALRHADPEEARRRIAIIEFVQPGPLWWAFDWPSAEAQARRSGASAPLTPEGWHPDRGAVVLIDEIDKADPAVPNGLLDALGHGRFDVPGGAPVAMNRAIRPLVAITTNEERALPDAFLRRCLVLHLSLPAERAALVATLMTRGRAHFPACPAAVLEQAADLLAADREEIRDRGLAPPGLAEYIDLLHAVLELGKTEDEQLGLLRRIAPLALRKHPPEPMQ
jgi:MoxR-like ATPase